jgi:hypothetical protein
VASVAAVSDLRGLYKASARLPSLVDVPPLLFLAIDGAGAPGNSDFQQAIGALYSIAYTAKFTLKKTGAGASKLPPLEGLYTTEGQTGVDPEAPDRMRWTLMIMQPPPVSRRLVEQASAEVSRKRPELPIADVRFEQFAEGLSAQVLHIGPYAREAPTIALLHSFILDQGLMPRGLHHEIYLGDPRRSAPERLKTIIRHPVERPT